MDSSFIVPIVGPSASGKTKFLTFLCEIFWAYAEVVPQDSYYLGPEFMPEFLLNPDNYDHPESLEWPLLIQHISDRKKGLAIRMPVYSMPQHRRSSDVVDVIGPSEITFIDGTLALAFQHRIIAPLRPYIGMSVFVDAPRALRAERRVKRDVEERGRTEESVRSQLKATVWPMEDMWLMPSKDNADIVIYNTGSLEDLKRKARFVAGAIALAAGIPIAALDL